MLKWMENITKEASVPLRYDDYERLYPYESVFHTIASSEGEIVFTAFMNLHNCLESDLNLDELNLGSELIRLSYGMNKNVPVLKIFGWSEGIATFDMRYEKETLLEASMRISSTNNTVVNEIMQYFEKWKHTKESTNQGRIYTLTKDRRGEITYSSIGIAKVPFIEENYEENIVQDIHYIVKNLQSSSPAGRITLLNGEPGTGKTYLIRSILSLVDKATFLLLPPDEVGRLTGPDLMSFFANQTDLLTPIVLVIEDADVCLASRKMDNMSLITGLLNISDGIIGNMIDIRIIATTNVENKDIDKAILRPGRLLKRVNINKLSPEKAMGVYKRLSGKEKEVSKPMTLAEIYYIAREDGKIIEEEVIPKVVGFGPPCPQPARAQGRG